MLRSERIASLIRDGGRSDNTDPLVIAPAPNLEQLDREGASSVDLRLGTWFSTLRPARITHLTAEEEQTWPVELTKFHYVPFGESYFLHPRSFVLGITLEWVRIPSSLGGQVIGRSSWGRRGLIIATATGVHPGFRGCLTLELSNVGEVPIGLRPGSRICQLSLFRAEGGTVSHIDQSQFIGSRRPGLGELRRDDVEKQLAARPTWAKRIEGKH
jgi:dCTP deaminase